MTFIEAVKTCFRKFITFSGRAPRSEFWYFSLFIILIGIPEGFIIDVIPEDFWHVRLFLSLTITVVLFFPQMAVTVRRLHDINRSGWWIFLPSAGVIPAGAFAAYDLDVMFMILSFGAAVLSFVVLFYWMAKKGDAASNRFGNNPLERILKKVNF